MKLSDLMQIKQEINKINKGKTSPTLQREVYAVNILDEIRKFYLAESQCEQINRLCNIIIATFGVLNNSSINKDLIICYENLHIRELEFILNDLGTIIYCMKNNKNNLRKVFADQGVERQFHKIIAQCFYEIEDLNKKPLQCLREKIKELK